MSETVTFVTTIKMPLRVRAQLDRLRVVRATRTGKRPSTRQLVVEALQHFIRAEMASAGR